MGAEGLVSKSQKKRCRKVEKVEGNRRSVQFGKNKAEEKPCTVKECGMSGIYRYMLVQTAGGEGRKENWVGGRRGKDGKADVGSTKDEEYYRRLRLKK